LSTILWSIDAPKWMYPIALGIVTVAAALALGSRAADGSFWSNLASNYVATAAGAFVGVMGAFGVARWERGVARGPRWIAQTVRSSVA